MKKWTHEEMATKMNMIHNCDCLSFIKQVPDNYFDLVLTSPPYNMRLRVRNGKYTTREKGDHFSRKYKHFDDDLPIDDFYEFHKSVLSELIRASSIVLYNFQPVTGSKEAFFKIIGFFAEHIKDVVVWDKKNGQPAMHENVLNSEHELCLIIEGDGKKGRAISSGNFERGKLSNVWRIGRGKKEVDTHSAVMPLIFADMAIRNFSKEDSKIFDPFSGSGTTGVAAKSLGRDWCGCELEPNYVEIANKRLEKVQGSLF